MTVDGALVRWPELGAVLVRWQMACVGGTMAAFERLTDVAKGCGVRGRFTAPPAIRSQRLARGFCGGDPPARG